MRNYRLWRLSLALSLLVTSYSLFVTNSSAEETITITTYYPSPYGSYNELTTTGNTYLATSGGKVGIGTASPDYKLTIKGLSDNALLRGQKWDSAGTVFAFNTYSNNSELYLYDNGGTIDILLSAGRDSYFNGGNVGIGTLDTQGYKLYVNGDVLLPITASNGVTANIFRDSYNTAYYLNPDPGADAGISAALRGKVGIGTPSPYYKLQVNAGSDFLAIYGTTYGSYGIGIYGSGTGPVGIGVYGYGGTYGVYGYGGTYGIYSYGGYEGIYASGGYAGVYGVSSTPTGRGVYGKGGETGVYGIGTSSGVSGKTTTANSTAVSGYNGFMGDYSSAGDGVYGNSELGNGVVGFARHALKYGVYGWHNSSGFGIYCQGGKCGGTVAWQPASDARLKEDIKTITDALNKVMKLRGVTFMRKDFKESGLQMGFIAQEALSIVPEVVSLNDNTGYYHMQTSELTALLVEAIKEQQAQISSLSSEIKGLRLEVKRLKGT